MIIDRSFLSNVFDRIDFKIAIRNGIGAGLALFVGNILSETLHRPNTVISSLWTCITTILVLQAHLGGTYRAAWNRFLGLIVGTLMGGAMTAWVGSDPVTLSISVGITIIICALFKLQESFRIAIATVAVIMIVWQLNPDTNPWVFSLYRFIDSCFGIIIGVVVAHTIWPYHAREKLRQNLAKAIEHLGTLYYITTSNEEASVHEKIQPLELIKELDKNFYDNRQILEDSKAELISKSARVQDWAILLAQMDELFEQVLSMRHVYKPNTQKLFDDSLRRHFHELIENINTSFKDIALMMKTGKWNTNLPDLDLSLTQLKEELARFRSTKTTREFGMEDVEAFFVFFYSTKTLLDALKRTETTIHTLIDEESF